MNQPEKVNCIEGLEQIVESMELSCIERGAKIFGTGVAARPQVEAQILAKRYRYNKIPLRFVRFFSDF